MQWFGAFIYYLIPAVFSNCHLHLFACNTLYFIAVPMCLVLIVSYPLTVSEVCSS